MGHTPVKAGAPEAKSDESAPPSASNATEAPAVTDVAASQSRPPLHLVQTPASGLKRKPQLPAQMPSSKLPYQIPKKPHVGSPLGFVAPPTQLGATPTPRPQIKGALPTPSAQFKGRAQTKRALPLPAPSASIKGVGTSRPRTSTSRVSTARLRLEFPTAEPTIEHSAEVPHFELREDPSFWKDNNVQVNHLSTAVVPAFL
ncbi:hypothetical protein PR202_gb24097 [Eleusine coracana subsp. coracana]|uniref:Uncharacterized protein n=1 Tax=Eleusine coracana subsp. coracana TaxID=191504 RepID=A0AAV5FLQ2_ELECO|nr:hypothetical protein PR202_gb24097 [Eleusine coracana subsp. coracana]